MMNVEVSFLDNIDKGSSISRQFEVHTSPPVIGRIVMTKLNGNVWEAGWIEVRKPTAAEITVQKPLGRCYTKEEIIDNGVCGDIVKRNIHNSGFFDGIFRKPIPLTEELL